MNVEREVVCTSSYVYSVDAAVACAFIEVILAQIYRFKYQWW